MTTTRTMIEELIEKLIQQHAADMEQDLTLRMKRMEIYKICSTEYANLDMYDHRLVLARSTVNLLTQDIDKLWNGIRFNDRKRKWLRKLIRSKKKSDGQLMLEYLAGMPDE